MNWWQIALIAVIAVIAIYFLRDIVGFARLNPEQKQALKDRSARRKQVMAYESQIAAGTKKAGALFEHSPMEPNKSLAVISDLRYKAGKIAIPDGFEKAHNAYLQYLYELDQQWKLHLQWQREPHKRDAVVAQSERVEEAQAWFVSVMTQAFKEANRQHLLDIADAHSELSSKI